MDFPPFPADWKPNSLGCTIARFCYVDDVGRATGGEIMVHCGSYDGGFCIARFRDGSELSFETVSREQINELVKRYYPKSMEFLENGKDFLDRPLAADYEQTVIFLRTPEYIKRDIVQAAEDADETVTQWCMKMLVESLPRSRASRVAFEKVFKRTCVGFRDVEESLEFLKLVEDNKAEYRRLKAKSDASARAWEKRNAATLKAMAGGKESPPDAAHR
jgi:hypothetical protein